MSEKPSRPALDRRSLTTFLIVLSFATMMVSGVVIYIAPQCWLAQQTGWTVAGVSKDQWVGLHMSFAVLFIVAAVIHLINNWKVLRHFFTSKIKAGMPRKRELAIALVIFGVIVAGTLANVPPFSALPEMEEGMKAYWRQNAGLAESDTHAGEERGHGGGRGEGRGRDEGAAHVEEDDHSGEGLSLIHI